MAKALDKELDSDSKVCPVVADDEGEWETKQSRATRGRQVYFLSAALNSTVLREFVVVH